MSLTVQRDGSVDHWIHSRDSISFSLTEGSYHQYHPSLTRVCSIPGSAHYPACFGRVCFETMWASRMLLPSLRCSRSRLPLVPSSIRPPSITVAGACLHSLRRLPVTPAVVRPFGMGCRRFFVTGPDGRRPTFGAMVRLLLSRLWHENPAKFTGYALLCVGGGIVLLKLFGVALTVLWVLLPYALGGVLFFMLLGMVARLVGVKLPKRSAASGTRGGTRSTSSRCVSRCVAACRKGCGH